MKLEKFVNTQVNKSIDELLSKQDQKTLMLWAADCAEHVLLFFEQVNPSDDRPRKAIEAGRAWMHGELAMSEARAAAFAAHSAARDTANLSAACAARAAGHAAATAHVAGHAAHAATYAAKAATYGADPAIAGAGTAEERRWQFQHLLEIVEIIS